MTQLDAPQHAAENENPLWDTIVIGAGPAGLSAALMLTRGRRRVLVLDHGVPRNRFTDHMHGVLGHEGLAPGELRRLGRAEVEAHEGVFDEAEVVSVTPIGDDDGARVHVATKDGRAFRARTVVVATGLRDELPNVPGLRALWGRGVYACPFCDGYEYRDRPIAVLAAGEHSDLKAHLLRQWSGDLVLLVNGSFTLGQAEARSLAARGVRVERSGVDEVLAGTDGRVRGVRLANGSELELEAIFTNPTFVPLTGMLDGVDIRGPEHPESRVWVVGNAGDPRANVPVSIGQGAAAGGDVAFALLMDEIAAAGRV
ncbi:NAD(P)/FAD-dependent oxidoreductase [Pseudoclavibacter sp. VKM Ac-2867]|uniref:NAD(P)/FAD-dependent oxidoreductase n=1 Tax=Pseudoclavibacter sp. VKM Ac-2867 TaxID=2783829 RepID=UPI001889F99E|nr:NAD(P)/FAD-dependent oxidoreductase [Pseudoclavibacter sp. VKM Ac-2867]MBF4457476.1 NAD(P)/FAD-dependent oxidoreductase [Pseudoclavibacter sp. VKM Ac-2867]